MSVILRGPAPVGMKRRAGEWTTTGRGEIEDESYLDLRKNFHAADRHSPGLAVLCAVVALAQDAWRAGGATARLSRRRNTGQRTDGQIEMDVVHALDASAALKNDLITAATDSGRGHAFRNGFEPMRQSSWPSRSLRMLTA